MVLFLYNTHKYYYVTCILKKDLNSMFNLYVWYGDFMPQGLPTLFELEVSLKHGIPRKYLIYLTLEFLNKGWRIC